MCFGQKGNFVSGQSYYCHQYSNFRCRPTKNVSLLIEYIVKNENFSENYARKHITSAGNNILSPAELLQIDLL